MKNLFFFLIIYIFLTSYDVISAPTGYIKKQNHKYGKAPQILEKQNGYLDNIRNIQTAPLQTNSILIDSARNGFGFSSSAPKSLDMSMDGAGKLWLGMAYRKYIQGDEGSGIIGVTELDVNEGFSNESFTFWDYVNNMANFGLGARFPSFLAAPEGPLPVWNQFFLQNLDETTVSDAFLSFDVFGWGAAGGGWIAPESWSTNSDGGVIHSLWLGSSDLYKDPSGIYHVGGVWEIELNTGNYTFLHGQSMDLQTWTWNSGTLNWSVNDIPSMNPPCFAWGSDGFGAWVSTGYRQSDLPDDEDFKVMVATTENYGSTWSDVKRFEWDELGIPSQIVLADSIFIINDMEDTVHYEGPASLGMSYHFDLIILPSNEMHMGCSIAWGPEGPDDTYYPNPLYMGLKDIISSDKGQSWSQNTIWFQRGQLFANDSLSDNGIETLNEIDLGYDEEGNIYAAWLDRDPHDVVPAQYPRFDDRQTEDNLDVWASMSRDGGKSWSETPLRITDDPQSPKGGLRLATRTRWFESDMGKTYILYQIPDYSRPLPPPITIQGDHVVWYYLAEAKGFPEAPVNIENLKNRIPQGFTLRQNYPNPFNPITRIQFELNSASKVTLNIYNLLGEEIAQLVNEPLNAGSYEVTWDAREMASGIYIYKIQTNNSMAVKKMILLR